MSIEKIAHFQNQNDETANIELARELAQAANAADIQEIVDALDKKEAIANDCIKVLYELGSIEPKLIAQYASRFLKGLRSNNNRLVWGCMTALATIAALSADEIFDELEVVDQAYTTGSVITVDQSMSVYAGIAVASERYRAAIMPRVLRHLGFCRPKDVAQHAERIAPCVTSEYGADFRSVLETRFTDLSAGAQGRVRKLLAKLY